MEQLNTQEAKKELKPKTLRELIQELINSNQFKYGSSIPINTLLNSLSIYPLTEHDAEGMSYKDMNERWKSDELEELNATNILRTLLLNEGKHFEKKNGNYRVCLPSENVTIADRFQKSAQRKIAKSRKLLLRTPKEFLGEINEISSKLLLLEKAAKKDEIH